MNRMWPSETWSDRFFEGLPPPAKLVFFHAWTNPATTSCGAYAITMARIAFETGLGVDEVESILPALAPQLLWFPEPSIVFVTDFYRRQYGGEKLRINAQRTVAMLPEPVRSAVLDAYPDLSMPDTPSVGDGCSIPSKEKGSREKRRKEIGSGEEGESQPPPPELPTTAKMSERRGARLPENWQPTEEMVAWACEETGWGQESVASEIEQFRDHWTATGERRIDWTATWRNWIRRSAKFRARDESRVGGSAEDSAMAAWVRVVRARNGDEPWPLNADGAPVVPGDILDAADALGGLDFINTGNGYHRADFLRAYRAVQR